MTRMKIPQPPQIVFGVWDRFGNPATKGAQARASRVGFKIHPNYAGHNAVYACAESIPARHFEYEQSTYNFSINRLIVDAIDRWSFLTDKTITSIQFTSGSSGYPVLDITLAEGPGIIRLRGNRWNGWSNATRVETPEDGAPWVVKRWLKNGKTIRLKDGRAINLSYYGRLSIESVPDWLKNELFEIEPAA